MAYVAGGGRAERGPPVMNGVGRSIVASGDNSSVLTVRNFRCPWSYASSHRPS